MVPDSTDNKLVSVVYTQWLKAGLDVAAIAITPGFDTTIDVANTAMSTVSATVTSKVDSIKESLEVGRV